MIKSQEKLKKLVLKLPESPGIYRFLGPKKAVLYVGKATSLKSRVRSYFDPKIAEKRSPLIEKMVAEAISLDFEKTDSVLEALILESYLIKKLTPPYNSADKDQKSWNYVVITNEAFPRVLVARERELTSPPDPLSLARRGGTTLPILDKFGPFTNGGQLKEALKIVRKIFPFRDKCSPSPSGRAGEGLPCFNYQLGLCPGVCIGAVNQKDYARTIKHIKTFFEGNKKKLVKDLEKEMRLLAKVREFEKAEEIKRKIFALKHIQDVALIKDSGFQILDSRFRIEAYDVAHISGANMVGVMTVIEDSEVQKSAYRMFKIRGQKNADDTKALKEILERRLKHDEWPLPDLLVVDGGVAQLNTAENLLKEKKLKIPVVAVTKDSHHKAREILNIENLLKIAKLKTENLKPQILLANSEAHRFALSFHRKLRDSVK